MDAPTWKRLSYAFTIVVVSGIPAEWRNSESVDVIAEAMGIVGLQAGCRLGDALIMMTDRAFVSRRGLDEIACAVLDGTIRFG